MQLFIRPAFLICILLCQYAHGQLCTFKTVAGYGPGWDEARKVIQCTDGGFLAVGRCDDDSTQDLDGVNVYLVKVDDCGRILWKMNYGLVSPGGQAYDGIDLGDGTYLVAGSVTSYHIRVLKVNKYGNVLWDKLYATSLSSLASSITKSVDGNYWIAGSINSDAFPKALIIKIDSAGQQKKQMVIPFDSAMFHISKLYEIDNFLYVIGVRGYGTSEDVAFMKLDTTGNVIWQKRPFASERCNIYDACLSSDSQSFVVILTKPTPGSIAKISLNGDVTKHKTATEFTNFGIKLTSCISGGYYVASLMKLDTAFNPVWIKPYTYDVGPSSIIETKEGDIVIAGVKADSGTVDLLIMKSDSTGRMIGFDEKAIDKTVVSVYPNPTQGQVNIVAEGTYSFILFDALGNKMVTGTFSNSVQIKTASFMPGLYIIQLRKPGERNVSVHRLIIK